MTTNPWINNWTATNEQDLMEDLVIESIQFYGIDCNYIPRTINNEDEIWNEDSTSSYESYKPIELYIDSIEGFEGDGTLLSRFGLEIRDQVTLTMAQKRFSEEFDPNVRTRPLEGDLLHFPLGNRVFQIKYVNHRDIFYQFGNLRNYQLTCEVFEYSSERLRTGIKYVDDLEEVYSQDISVSGVEYDNPLDAAADNEEFESEGDELIDFSESNPFGNL